MSEDKYYVMDQENLVAVVGMILESENDYPMTITVKRGKERRRDRQNRLQWQWLNDMARQGDKSVKDYRAECKLHHGIPVRRETDESFRSVYDEIVMPLPYEQKLVLMVEPFDTPVTSDMNVAQMTAYLNELWVEYTGQGIKLTDPSMMGLESYSGGGIR